MKKLIFTALFFFTINAIYSQDLIVTNQGDSINCKVTEIKSGNIYFDFEKDDETRSTMLSLSNVKEQQRDFYTTKNSVESLVIVSTQDLIVLTTGDTIKCKITNVDSVNIYFDFEKDEVTRNTMLPLARVKEHKENYYTNSKIVEDNDYSHLRIALGGGYSYRTAEVSDDVSSDFEDYVDGLKSGYHYGANLTYFFKKPYGIGFKYNAYKSSNSMSVYSYDYGYGEMSDDITISYYGPTVTIRSLSPNKKNAFLMDFSLGYMEYKDNAILFDESYTIKGNTVGLIFGMNYDIGLTENLALGLGFSITAGTLSEYEINDGTSTETVELDEDSYESLTRLDLTVSLVFNN